MRKSRWAVLTVTCIAAAVTLRWVGALPAEEKKSGKLIHVVLFELKDGLPKGEAKALIDDGYKLLAKVPSVKRFHSGAPSAESKVANVKDYDVALYCEFDDAKGLAAYIEHDLHQQYLKKHKQHWAGARVIDFGAR